MKRIAVISDLQVPFHDERAVKNVAAFIRKWKPDDPEDRIEGGFPVHPERDLHYQ